MTAFAILAAALLGYSLLSRRLERVSISGGRLVERAFATRWMSSGLGAMAPLALAALCWALADTLGGNGCIAAFVGGSPPDT